MSDRISHARMIPYWTLKDMKQAIKSCHNLWNKQQPMFDELYMLGVMTYGQLQKNYKDQKRRNLA